MNKNVFRTNLNKKRKIQIKSVKRSNGYIEILYNARNKVILIYLIFILQLKLRLNRVNGEGMKY